MCHCEIGAHFGTSKKGKRNFVYCEFFYSLWENNQSRITIVKKLVLSNYYLWSRNNWDSLAICVC